MPTIKDIRDVDDYGVTYHEHTIDRGYRFVKDSNTVIVERAQINGDKFVAARPITPFGDISREYDLAYSETPGINEREDQRRRRLADHTDKWLNGLTINSHRRDAHRCWTNDPVPHVICRYTDKFRTAINGSILPSFRYMVVARSYDTDRAIAAIGNVYESDNPVALANICLTGGMGFTRDQLEAGTNTWQVLDLDSPQISPADLHCFQASLLRHIAR